MASAKKDVCAISDDEAPSTSVQCQTEMQNEERNLDHRRDEDVRPSTRYVIDNELAGATGSSQQRSNVQAHPSSDMAKVEGAATFNTGRIGTLNAAGANFNIVTNQVFKLQAATAQIKNRIQTTHGNGDEDAKDFFKDVDNATLKNVQYDIRGKRKKLREVTKHPSTIFMVIELEEQGIGAQSSKSHGRKQGPIGKDIKEIGLKQLHEGGVRHSLLVGDAGEGKTTASKQYAKFVIENLVSSLGDIKLVLFIPMMDIDTEQTTPFHLLITKELGRLPRHHLAGKKWMEENSSQILFIFDGLDQSNFSLEGPFPKTDHESLTSPAKIIANILSGHIYPGAKILTTSRWHTFWTLDDKIKPNRLVALRGFSEDAKMNLFKKLLPSNADSIIEHIKNNAPYLLFVCSTPNILLNAASVFSKPPENWPGTQTGILSHAIIDLLRSENAPRHCFYNICLKLAQVAYEGIRDDIFQFPLHYLEESGLRRSDLDYFMTTNAILVSDQSKVQQGDMRCYFYHQTIQEFFAALYICNVGDAVTSYVDDLFEDPRMHNVMLFWSGIIGHKSTFSMVCEHIIKGEAPRRDMREILKKKILSTLNDGSITDIEVCRVLQECDSHFVDGVASSISGVEIHDVLDPREQFLIFSLVSKLGQLEVLNTWELELNSSNISSCAKSIKRLKATYRLTLGASLSKDHESDIAHVLSKAAFYEIQLDCGDDVIKFSLSCIKGRYVEQIHIDGNHNFGLDGCNHLVDFLGHMRILKLSMCDCNLSTKKLKAMSDRLQTRNVKIEWLDLSKNIPSDSEYVDQVTELILSAGSERVSMEDCQLTVDHVKDLGKALIEKEIILQELNLSQNIPNAEKEYLPAICQLFHCVRCWIWLRNWQFDDDNLMVLRRGLEISPFKEQLKVLFGKASGKLKKLSFDGVAD